MAGRSSRKRGLEDFDPNVSDPEDPDWDEPPLSSAPRRSRPSRSQAKKSGKRQRRARDSDDGIVDHDEEISEEEWSSGKEEEEKPELNLTTGRPMRRTTKANVKYEESSGEDVVGVEASPSKRTTSRQSRLLVKLRYPPGNFPRSDPSEAQPAVRSTRTRTLRTRSTSETYATKPDKRIPTPDVRGVRRSSRISHDSSGPIVSLADTGRHAQIIQPGTRSPEARQPSQPQRRTTARKGLKQPTTSVIMEVSREGSEEQEGHLARQRDDGEPRGTPNLGREDEGAAISEEPQVAVQSSDPSLPGYSATQLATQGDSELEAGPEEEPETTEGAVIEESAHEEEAEEDHDDDDEDPVKPSGPRSLRSSRQRVVEQHTTRSSQKRPRGIDETSDFEPGAEEGAEEDMSGSNQSPPPSDKKRKRNSTDESSQGERRSRRIATRSSHRSRQQSERESSIDEQEVAEEAAELTRPSRSKRRRTQQIIYDDQPRLRTRGNKPDYRVYRPELLLQNVEDDDAPQTLPARGKRAAPAYRSLFSIAGPFGGMGGPPPVLGGPEGTGLAGGADSDSSDDEGAQTSLPRGAGAPITPSSALPHNLHGHHLQNADMLQGVGATPTNLGRVKDKKALADTDPLGIDADVNFGSVGGLETHISQLKEMVQLPLQYPEVFLQLGVTPPRGVLFHGPPGTGKTLLARALAANITTGGKKVTFYMRKGADALSKWVGEAERQLRLLFETARKTQPSIIFFDEIDGLAPVRSSKQEQIHASIVATLLALMDGMDGRGQVVVIGATNRPDSVDPALRRPGRFDREFYFPLPDTKARRAILDIHTKKWNPPPDVSFKDQLAELTKGYGGADIRALCTEAALNAVQGTYPQIYSSNEKLIIDPSKIKVTPKDFIVAMDNMVPSSQRSTTATSAPLEQSVEPLLRDALNDIAKLLDEVLPQRKKLTALEEAQYEERDNVHGFQQQTRQSTFERSRIHRPRLLIRGRQGMGQQHIGSALLNKFERLHVQSFDLATILGDSASSPEATITRLFTEVKRHKPSVIYIPNVDVWYHTIGASAARLFNGLLQSLSPSDQVLVLAIVEEGFNADSLDDDVLKLFGYSKRNVYELQRPNESARSEFFHGILNHVRASPSEFPPDPANRKKRRLEELEVAPPEPTVEHTLSKEELKAQKKSDRYTLNVLKMHLQLVMNLLTRHYRRFRNPTIEEKEIAYLFDEQSHVLTSDLPEEEHQTRTHRPYEVDKDERGVPGLREVATGKFFYNLELNTVEKRLSNGYYKRPKDFLDDIRRIRKDAENSGDDYKAIRAREMFNNVEVDMDSEAVIPREVAAACEEVYRREQMRAEQVVKKVRLTEPADKERPTGVQTNVQPPQFSFPATEQSTGPVNLGGKLSGREGIPPVTPMRPILPSPLSNGTSVNGDYGRYREQPNDPAVPSRPDTDVQMGGTDHPQTPARNPEAHDRPAPGAGVSTQTPLSQHSAVTRIAQGSHVVEYQNYASTTSSGQKTGVSSGKKDSDHQSKRGSEASEITNGVKKAGEHPNFSSIQPLPGAEEFPDTQEKFYEYGIAASLQDREMRPIGPPSSASHSNGTGGGSQSSPSEIVLSQSQRQMPPPAAKRKSDLSNILNPNDTPSAPPSSHQPQSQHQSQQEQQQQRPSSSQQEARFAFDPTQLGNLHNLLVSRSSGFGVEQLEQVHAALMNEIWATRADWDRDAVAKRVEKVFLDTVADMEECQKMLDMSQRSADGERR